MEARACYNYYERGPLIIIIIMEARACYNYYERGPLIIIIIIIMEARASSAPYQLSH
jgi:hypothetical protein